jgi:leucyl aminopeptidase
MSLQTQVITAAPEAHSTPLLILVVPQGPLPASLAAIDRASEGTIGRCYDAGDFSGKRDESALLYPPDHKPWARLLLVGVGKPDHPRPAVRRAAAVGAKRARVLGVPGAALFVTPEAAGDLPARDLGQVVVEGAAKGAWYFPDFKKPPEEKKPPFEQLDLLGRGEASSIRAGIQIGAAIAEGQMLCRRLQALPGNHLPPRRLAEAAEEVARRAGHGITVLDRRAIEAEGMGALLAVAQGSSEEPRFIALEYAGAGGAPVVLVGKGVSFDSGGISIKPAQNMEDMKYDMSGAAAVLGTFEMLGRLRPRLAVVGLIPSAENMPSATAMRPGDVVKSHLGKTIEVVNTDAEGRMLLADALSYARRYSPACAIDLATLTGAISIALGPFAAGLMGNDRDLIATLIEAGQRADERVWELPLWDEYKELNKSEIADVKNSGGRSAGSITAGWFLREFVEGFPWAHVDIAATAYTDREDPSSVKGPTGIGVRLLSEFLLSRA